MIVDHPAVGDPNRRTLSVRRWALWTIPTPARLFMLLSEVVAAAITITLLLVQPVSPTDLLRVAVLAVLAIGYAEGTARIERLKRYLCSGKTFSNQVSVWICAGVLTVPAGWAAVLVTLIYSHVLLQRHREKSNHAYRVTFTAATEILAALAAAGVLSAAGGGDALRGGLLAPAAVVVALLMYTLTNFGLVLIGMWLTLRPPSVRAMLPEADVIGYELATLGLGLVAAEFVLHTLALTPVVIGLAVCLHRSSLVTELHRSSAPTPKPGCSTTPRGPNTPPACCPAVSETTNPSPSCSATSTTSRRSTTPTATWSGTRSSSPWPTAFVESSAVTTASAATAVTSSSSSSTDSSFPTPNSSPTGSAPPSAP